MLNKGNMPKNLSKEDLSKLKQLGYTNSFVLFKADWCGFCQMFMPVYEQLEKMFKDAPIKETGKPIRFFIFNCTEKENAMHAMQKYDIEGYPTLKWINKTGNIINYPGGRDKNDIIKYVCENTGVCLKRSQTPMNIETQSGGKLTQKDLKLIFRTSGTKRS